MHSILLLLKYNIFKLRKAYGWHMQNPEWNHVGHAPAPELNRSNAHNFSQDPQDVLRAFYLFYQDAS
jgi:hypothetical protein